MPRVSCWVQIIQQRCHGNKVIVQRKVNKLIYIYIYQVPFFAPQLVVKHCLIFLIIVFVDNVEKSLLSYQGLFRFIGIIKISFMTLKSSLLICPYYLIKFNSFISIYKKKIIIYYYFFLPLNFLLKFSIYLYFLSFEFDCYLSAINRYH